MIRFLAYGLAIALGAGAAAAENIEIGVAKRSYLTQFPETKPAPLVVVLHGNTQTGADIGTRTSWSLVASRERFGVIYPDGLNHAWADLRPDSRRAGQAPPAGTDDVAFIAKLIEKYVADGFADPKHVYITGLSNGGHDDDAGLRTRRPVRGRRQRHHESHRRVRQRLSSFAAGADAGHERHCRSPDPL